MSRTKHVIKGKEYPAKTKKKLKDKKFFGFTYGLHSEFENAKKAYEKDGRPSYKKRASEMGIYPVKGKDFIKNGYGRGSKKKVKNYKKEIEIE